MKALIITAVLMMTVSAYGGTIEQPVPTQPVMQQQQIAIGTGYGGSSVSEASANAGALAQANAPTTINTSVGFKNERPLLQIPEINPIHNQLITGVIEVAKNLPNYDIPCTPLGKDEKVQQVLRVEDGTFITSIRVQEIDQVIIDGCGKALKKALDRTNKVRYRVWLKPASKGAGIGGGATYGTSDLGTTSGYASALGILPGFAVSTIDPAFVVIYYLIK